MKTILKIALIALAVLAVAFSGCLGSDPDANNTTNITDVPVEGDNITPSNYTNTNNWMVISQTNDKPVDVFYLYPTAWARVGNESVLCPIDDADMRTRAKEMYGLQATAFDTVGNMYAPYYRQMDAAFVLEQTEENRIKYTNGAPKTDIIAAFDYYIRNYNDGRPFILAGHSQGSMLTKEILFDYMKENPDVYERMVAAYVIGYGVTEQDLKDHTHLKFAEEADDIGVIISYNTEAPNMTAANPTAPAGSVAINPISWTRINTTAPADASLGSYMEINGTYQKVTDLADATVNLERGTVVCSSVNPEDYQLNDLFPLGIYHSMDYPFYYYNLRENAEVRTAVYLNTVSA